MKANSDLIEGIKGFSEAIALVCKEIDKINDNLSFLTKQLQDIFVKLDEKKYERSLAFDSLSELCNFIDNASSGEYLPVIKEKNFFCLLVGDEEALLYYPYFVDMGLPKITAYEGMCMSTYSIVDKKWIT